MPMHKFDTCCTGAGDLQDGPLLVDFSPAVRAVTVRTWDYSVYQLGAPAGINIRVVNAQGDTIARATTDGTTPPSFSIAGIARLVIFPIPTGLKNDYGDTRVVPVQYQIEYEPVPCPIGDPIGDDRTFRKFIRDQLTTSLRNFSVERSGTTLRVDGSNPPSWDSYYETLPGATQCRNEFAIRTSEGYTLGATWHTHGLVPGTSFGWCPTAEADAEPGKVPSNFDYATQERTGVPMFIIDLDDIIRIGAHGDTTKTSRDNATSYTNWSQCPGFFD